MRRIQRSAAFSSDEEEEETVQSSQTPRGRRRSGAAANRTQSQLNRTSATSSQSNRTVHENGIDEADRDKMVADAIFHILTQEKKRLPVKKAEVFKNAGVSGKGRDTQEEVWNRTLNNLLEVFGLKLQEPPEAPENQAHVQKRPMNVYYLINALPEPVEARNLIHLKWKSGENSHLGLLYTILALIFMSNDVVKEDVLFRFLKNLGVYEDELNSNHGNTTRRSSQSQRQNGHHDSVSGVLPEIKELFGDVRKLIFQEFSNRQHYIDILKVDQGGDQPENVTHEFRWGPRAKLEVKRSVCLKIVATLYECRPDAFTNQYNRCIEEEGEDCFKEDDQVEPEQGENNME